MSKNFSLDRLGERYNKHNLELIEGFINRCQAVNLSENRINFYLTYIHLLGKWMGEKDFEKMTKKEVEKVVAEINQGKTKRGTKYTDWTRRGFFITLKKLMQFVHGYDWHSREHPECTKWINGHVCKIKQETVSAEDLLSAEEIFKMIEVANNPRDKLWLSLAFETGWRPDEIHSIRLKDIKIEETGALVTIRGYKRKKPETLLVVHSVPRLLAWLDVHPKKDDSEASLWVGLTDGKRGKPITRNYFRLKLKKWARKAGIRRRVYPYLLRHSSITENRFNFNPGQQKIYYGWAQMSKMPGYYTHLKADDVNQTIAEKTGKTPKKEEKFKLRVCGRCRHENPPDRDFCLKCNLVLTEKGLKIKEEQLVKDKEKMIAEIIERKLQELLERENYIKLKF